MSHPIELLVALEDGTLREPERAVLRSHLQGCARCREELRTATAGRGAMRALETEPMPEGLLDGVLAESQGPARDGARVTSITARTARWQRVMAVAGVAAAIVLVASLALPHLGSTPANTRLTQEDGSAAAPVGPVPTGSASSVEIVDQDYDLAAVSDLAKSYAAPLAGVTAGPTENTSAQDIVRAPKELEPATTCLQTAFQTLPGEPVRVLRARYLGQPAYFGFFLVRPGDGQPPTAVRILIASVDGCAVLVSSEAKLP
jgi:anti-sigma factor RsiW